MKAMLGKLKGGGFKNLFIQHGEKLGFGVVVLIVLGVLAFGTSWARTDKSPDVIAANIDKASVQIQNSTWPDTKRQEFALVDFSDKSQALLSPFPTQPFEFGTNMFWPLYRKQELAKEAEYLAVEDLRADPGLAILSVPDVPPEGQLAQSDASTSVAADGPAEAASTRGPAIPRGEFKARTPGSPGAPGAGGLDGSVGAVPGFPGGAAVPGLGSTAAVPGIGAMPEMGGMMGEGMMMGGPTVKPRGVRFVAVRGVWPLAQQLTKIQRALNLQTQEEARQALSINSFVLERQRAVQGDDPWSGEWEEVDISIAKEVVEESDFDYDPVRPEVIDTVITMPLPLRLLGYWDDFATHPLIENFKLSPAEMEQQRLLEEKLQEQYDRYAARIRKQTGPEKGGFAGLQRDFRQMGADLFTSDFGADAMSGLQQSMMDAQSSMMMPPGMPGGMGRAAPGMPTGRGAAPGGLNPKDQQALRAKLLVVGRLLLFRYMDFAVEPGVAYRYRVKLKLLNPNFGRPLETVVDSSVIEGDLRDTPWSNPSPVAIVPETVAYFLQKIDRDPHQLDESSRRAVAELEMFEWDAEMGTMKMDTIRVGSLGQFIGETKKSLLLNVAKPSFKEETVTFSTDDMLLDAVGTGDISLAAHPDLKIAKANKGVLALTGEALVLQESGDLKLLDPNMGQQKRKDLASRVASERADFEHLKNKEEVEFNALDGAMPAGMMPGMPGMEMMDPKAMEQYMKDQAKKKKKNPRKPTGAPMPGSMSY